MKFKDKVKRYLDKRTIEYIEEHSVCRWKFKGDKQLSEEEIKELLEKIDKAFPIK